MDIIYIYRAYPAATRSLCCLSARNLRSLAAAATSRSP